MIHGRVFVGIDPGKSGALAAILDDGAKEEVKLVPFGDDGMAYVFALRSALEGNIVDVSNAVMIEKVWSMPHEGVSSAFSFGANFGFIVGVSRAIGFIPKFVTPQVWQKHFGISGSKSEHITKVKELFPGVDLRRTERCKKEHDGFADALLIAEYLRRTSQNRDRAG